MKKLFQSTNKAIEPKRNLNELTFNEMFEIRGGGSEKMPVDDGWD